MVRLDRAGFANGALGDLISHADIVFENGQDQCVFEAFVGLKLIDEFEERARQLVKLLRLMFEMQELIRLVRDPANVQKQTDVLLVESLCPLA